MAIEWSLSVADTVEALSVPARSDFHRWIFNALSDRVDDGSELELHLAVIGDEEMAELNGQYRNKPQPTNVLSFPADEPLCPQLLGDIALCAPVIEAEAAQQAKTPTDHWAHMVTHAVLHLRGYDHETEAEAHEMETLEIERLAMLGIQDPYIAAG